MKLTKSQTLVLAVIKANEGVQNNEHKLLEAVWLSQGWQEDKSLYWNITRVMHAETVARARRTLYDLGLITYSKEALKFRDSAFRKEQNAHSYHEEKVASIVKPKWERRIIDNEVVMVEV